MKKIKLEIKSVYGEDKLYPACEDSKLFARIAKTKTITQDVLALIKKLEVEIIYCVKVGNELKTVAE
jgi:hypothetical protein